VDQKKTKRSLDAAKIVYIEWVDAVADAGWESNVKADIHLCRSIGWVVDETDDAICLANTVSQEDSNARIHIPKAWVRNRRIIKVENQQRKVKRKVSTAVDKGPDTKHLFKGS